MKTIQERTVCGRYRIVQLLGQGGMGIVYKAEDTVDRRCVALKQLKPKVSPHSMLMQLFESHKTAMMRVESPGHPAESSDLGREFLHMTALSHPNLIEVYNYETASDGAAYLVMELLEGQSLQQILDAGRERCAEQQRIRRSVDQLQLIDFGIQMLRGLAFLHNRGYVHCDLKPANIFVLDGDSRIKILDYGLMREQSTAADHSLGTPVFAAPEQLSRGNADMRSDLYSVGVILLELCGGIDSRTITTEQSIAGIVEQTAADYKSNLPVRFQHWLLGLLRLDPDHRWQSAEEALVALFELSGRRKQSESPASTQSYILGAGLLGRDDELCRLRRMFDELHQCHGQAKLIAGASGIGKSRLIAEFGKYVKINGGRFVVGHYHENANDRFTAPREILRDLLPISPSKLIEKHKNELAFIYPELVPEHDLRPHDIYDAAGNPDQVYHLFASFLVELSDTFNQTIVLVFEDLHFQPEYSLINILRAICVGRRLLILGTTRDDEADSRFLESWNHDTILLQPFPQSFLKSMTDDIFLGAPPGEQLLNGLEQITSGNPFFIEQYLLELARRGFIHKRDLKWEYIEHGTADLQMPAVEMLLERRLGDLTDDETRYMELLSACTGNTPTRYLAHLFKEHVCADVHKSLLNKHLISADHQDPRPYHHYIKQYFYNRIQNPEEIHRTLAELFENFAPEDIALIAFHYARSGRRDKLLQYLEPAAEYARTNNNYPLALDFYSRLIELLRPHTSVTRQLVDALFNKTMLSQGFGTSGETEADIRHLLSFALPDANSIYVARLHLALGTILRHQSSHKDALESLEQAEVYSRAAGDLLLLAQCYFAVGSVLGNLGRLPEALDKCQQAVELYEQLQLTPPGNLLSYMGGIHQYTGDAATSREFQLKCLQISEQQGDKNTMATALYYLGEICSMNLEFSRALEYYERALELSKMLGNRKDSAQILHGIGLTHSAANSYHQALEYLLQSLNESRAVGDDDFVAITLSQLAKIYTTIGEFDKARQMIEEQGMLAGESNSAYIAVMNCFALSFWYAKQGEFSKAEACLLENKARAAELGEHMLVNVLFDLAKLYFSIPRPELTLEYSREALALYEKLGQVHNVAQLFLLMAETLLQLERFEEARNCIKQGLEQAEAQNQTVFQTQGLMLEALLDYYGSTAVQAERALRLRTTERLQTLADETKDEIIRTELYYKLWQLHSAVQPRTDELEQSTEKFRSLALKWLRALAGSAPSSGRSRRIKLLEDRVDAVSHKSTATAAD